MYPWKPTWLPCSHSSSPCTTRPTVSSPSSPRSTRRSRPPNSPYEIVFVDDGSTDGSFAAMERIAAVRGDVRVVKLRRNFGKAAALTHGFEASRGEYVVTMDGDRQDDPAEIPRLVAPLDDGLRPRLRLEAEPPGPAQQDAAVALLQLDGAAHHGHPTARLQLRPQVLPARRRRDDLRLRRAAPLHPGRRRPGGLPRHGGAREPPPPHGGALQVRLAALPARLPRPAHGALPRALPAPAPAPVRRHRHAAHPLGFLVELYLTIDKLVFGHPIGQRPLLLLGVARSSSSGVQLLSLGLIGELIANTRARSGPDPAQIARVVEGGRELVTAPDGAAAESGAADTQ